MRLRFLLALSPCFVLCLTACRPAWQDALERGKAAQAAGDDVAAAAAFRLACEQEAPPDTGACRAAKSASARAAHEAIERSEKSCRDGELGVCFSGLAGARGVTTANTKERNTIEELLEISSALHMESCGALPLKTLDDATARYRCVSLLRKELGLPAHTARMTAQAQKIATFLLDEAHRHEVETAFGAGAVNAGLARCVVGGAEAKRLFDDDGARFLDASRLPAVVTISGLSPSARDRLCANLKPTPLRCSSEKGAEKTGVIANGSFKLAALKHSSKPTTKIIEYIAGTEKIANPEYDLILKEIEVDRRALKGIDKDAAAGKVACAVAEATLIKAANCTDCKEAVEKEKTCTKAQALADAAKSANDAFDTKKVLLSRTPRQVERNRMATHSWIETQHRWELPFALDVDGAPALKDVLVVEDFENPGFAPANIIAKKLTEPTTASLLPGIEERAIAHAQTELTRQLVVRGKALSPTCHAIADDGAQIDCQLKALWYGGSDPVPTWLNDLAARVDAPWPRAICID
ncbi:MAG: hypothetical protein Q8O67_19325 [Deltaproteobacteria bacterium]|nr:hypothetical protein [Deltaproteobacteria bacterium]